MPHDYSNFKITIRYGNHPLISETPVTVSLPASPSKLNNVAELFIGETYLMHSVQNMIGITHSIDTILQLQWISTEDSRNSFVVSLNNRFLSQAQAL